MKVFPVEMIQKSVIVEINFWSHDHTALVFYCQPWQLYSHRL